MPKAHPKIMLVPHHQTKLTVNPPLAPRMALAVCLLMRSAESLEVAEGSRTVASLGAKAEAAAAPRITTAAAYLIGPSTGWYVFWYK